jgi:hypothetical protein
VTRTLNEPRAARVRATGQGVPVEVNGRAIALVRESWLVEDRWWSEPPLRRRYWELLSEGGRNMVVFHDLAGGERGDRAPGSGGWFEQGA